MQSSSGLLSPEIRKALESAIDHEFIEKLTSYATLNVKRHFIKRRVDSMPEGKQIEDFVLSAFDLVFSGIRRWDPTRVPDPLVFMKGVIRSNVSHYFDSAGNVYRQYPIADESSSDPIDDFPDLSQSTEAPLYETELKSYLKRLAETDPVMKDIIYCIEEGISLPREIVEFTGHKYEVVTYNLKKIRNIIKRYEEEGV